MARAARRTAAWCPSGRTCRHDLPARSRPAPAWRTSGSIRQDLPMPAALAGQPDPGLPDRRRSRPVVSPAYAQGACYGTNRAVAAAPWRHAGPPAPLLSTTRAAPPSGCHLRRPRSSIARTGRVFRKNRTRGRPRAGAGDPERTDAAPSLGLSRRTMGDPHRGHAATGVAGGASVMDRHQPRAACVAA